MNYPYALLCVQNFPNEVSGHLASQRSYGYALAQVWPDTPTGLSFSAESKAQG